MRLSSVALFVGLTKRHTKRKCEPDLDLPCIVGSGLPETKDNEKQLTHRSIA